MTRTHTVAELELSAAAYREIREKLEAAGYHHCIGANDLIDMQGIGVTRTTPDPNALACTDCGKLYRDFPLDVVLPDDQWRAIFGRPGGVLCAGCIVARAKTLDRSVVMHARIEFAPATPPTYVIDADGFQWAQVQSSNIEAIAWRPNGDGWSGEMRVRFKNGGTYEYANVGVRVFCQFQRAESKGTFLAKEFKPYPSTYPCRKVEPSA